ncbi:hypothetical protein [Salinispora tropica]|uniref:hypothetical protein n=1 Tax=Salinispora tropica TaxID=168695 RepID=UPI00030DB047|nr:hypothetical protein [Salinispora tropica]
MWTHAPGTPRVGSSLERSTPYLAVDLADLTARLLRLPVRSEVPVTCQEQLVVEHYSR